jgi:hypothetical protein
VSYDAPRITPYFIPSPSINPRGMEMDATLRPDEVFFTDKQLRDRWHCSPMKLWRLRQKGKLKAVKVGGTGPNLTPSSEVKAVEEAS